MDRTRLAPAGLMHPDPFGELARYYDPLMAHVDYDRWFVVATAVAESLALKTPPRHLDLACGTGTLLARLRVAGWSSIGADLSPAMLRTARKSRLIDRLVCADMTALPFRNSFDYITCLFDS
ncbi:MAG: class I SAM-dependent methyltransferase, partial [Candidatus Hydrogenedentales bacterium]